MGGWAAGRKNRSDSSERTLGEPIEREKPTERQTEAMTNPSWPSQPHQASPTPRVRIFG